MAVMAMSDHMVMKLDSIEDGSAAKVEVEGHTVALIRLGESVYAIGDTCSHEEVSLSEGFVDPDECTIECWRHGASFDLKTGAPTSLPAVKPVPTYEVSVVDGEIWVAVSAGSESVS